MCRPALDSRDRLDAGCLRPARPASSSSVLPSAPTSLDLPPPSPRTASCSRAPFRRIHFASPRRRRVRCGAPLDLMLTASRARRSTTAPLPKRSRASQCLRGGRAERRFGLRSRKGVAHHGYSSRMTDTGVLVHARREVIWESVIDLDAHPIHIHGLQYRVSSAAVFSRASSNLAGSAHRARRRTGGKKRAAVAW